jgi:integrase
MVQQIIAYTAAGPHMLRHACGYALANKGHDTRALQAYLGHRNIQHTVRTPSYHRRGSRIFGAIKEFLIIKNARG